MKKIALISILGNVGSTFNSQGGGYGLIATKMVRDAFPDDSVDVNPEPDTWSSYDKIMICEGVNYVEGTANIPGGPQPIHTKKMEAIAAYKGEVGFINSKFDFEAMNKRIKLEGVTFPDGPVIDLFMSHGVETKKSIISDSHGLSVWRPGFTLNFTPGRTLHGFLNRSTPEEINNNFNDVVLYFGNIDLRFHLMRQEDPIAATINLFTRYVEFAKQLNNATLVELLPVEHESRKIPGTGLYKKQPFFGTREERTRLRKVANKIMHDSGLPVISWPSDWEDSDGTKMLDILESKQSVHLKPKYYQYINEITNVSK